MDQNEEKKRGIPLSKKQQLALALAGTALLALIASTLAWLNFNRTLQTITRMQMPILWLKESDGVTNATEIELGNLDFSKAGSKEIPFAVYATAKTKYILQLAYTTNLPLSYSLYRKDENNLTLVGFSQKTVDNDYSYGNYGNVRPQAYPAYQQTDNAIEIGRNEVHYYVLKVEWTNTNVSAKETDMIYLTVATALEEITPTTQTAGGGA